MSLSNIGVLTVVGWIEFTRMECSPSSSASVRIRPITPVLELP